MPSGLTFRYRGLYPRILQRVSGHGLERVLEWSGLEVSAPNAARHVPVVQKTPNLYIHSDHPTSAIKCLHEQIDSLGIDGFYQVQRYISNSIQSFPVLMLKCNAVVFLARVPNTARRLITSTIIWMKAICTIMR